MKRKLVIALVALVASLALWGLARAQLSQDERAEQMRKQRMILIQKVMETYAEHPEQSPNWRSISSDLGVLLREDERFGYRGTLYVRVNGEWEPVAIDGIDSFGYVPLKR